MRPLVLGPKNGYGLGPRGVASPVPDYLASFDQLHSCATLLLSLSLNPAEAQADMLAA